MTPDDWKKHYGVTVPIEVSDDGTPHCAFNGCMGCAQCRAISNGAPIITRSEKLASAQNEADRLRARVAELEALINTPHTDDFFEAVRLEAAHQVERWGPDHDADKGPQDWFWLLGYLGGKALRAAIDGDAEKAKHHCVSSAAALKHWFASLEKRDG